MSRWFEIALPVPAGLVDEAAALLDFAGFGGIEVRERGDAVQVVVVVEADDDARQSIAVACEALEVLGAGEPVATELDPKVWTENWKSHFARRTFAGRIEVRPPWEEVPTEGLVSLVINPGMAFGTGLHETTAGCLELLVDEVRPGMTVADIGCGSGILAIAAARLGAVSALATDVDPLAVAATLENIEANGVAHLVEVELEPGEIGMPEWENDARPGLTEAREAAADQRPIRNSATAGGFASRGPAAFDLLVANILAESLCEMHEPLTAAVKPGGILVLSGIEAKRLEMVEQTFVQAPWALARTVRKGDWVSLSLHHEGLAGTSHTSSAASGSARHDDPSGAA